MFEPRLSSYFSMKIEEGSQVYCLVLRVHAITTCRAIQHSPDAVAPGLCWADRGGWGEVDAGDVAMHRVRQNLKSCHRYIVTAYKPWATCNTGFISYE